MHLGRRALLGALVCLVWAGPQAAEQDVGITHAMKFVVVQHNGKQVRIERNPDTDNMIDPDFSLTSHPCPPFCNQSFGSTHLKRKEEA
jgi:hypothetical protein